MQHATWSALHSFTLQHVAGIMDTHDNGASRPPPPAPGRSEQNNDRRIPSPETVEEVPKAQQEARGGAAEQELRGLVSQLGSLSKASKLLRAPAAKPLDPGALHSAFDVLDPQQDSGDFQSPRLPNDFED